MYAVIKTGGKQYRVSPGDVLVVEKLDGAEVGGEVSFDQVLMLSDGGETVVGAPLVEGAVVRATFIETRKGEKIKVFKKIRRQGYRRTQGHRQPESVLRVVGMEGAGKSAAWDGEVDLTPRSVLVARARGLAPMVDSPAFARASGSGGFVEQPVGESPADLSQTLVDPQAASETGSMESVTPGASDGAPPAPATNLPDPEAEGFVDQQTAEVEAEQAEKSGGDA